MTLKQLYYFVEICEDYSYTAAAKRLYVTQQGLSKAIVELENELDCSLLLVPKEHFLAQKEKVRLSDLQDLPMVLYSETNVQMFSEWCKRFEVKPRIEAVVADIISVYQYASQKGVFGISMEFLKGKFYYPELVEIPFDEEEIVWELNVVVRNEKVNYEPVKKLIECFTNKRTLHGMR